MSSRTSFCYMVVLRQPSPHGHLPPALRPFYPHLSPAEISREAWILEHDGAPPLSPAVSRWSSGPGTHVPDLDGCGVRAADHVWEDVQGVTPRCARLSTPSDRIRDQINSPQKFRLIERLKFTEFLREKKNLQIKWIAEISGSLETDYTEGSVSYDGGRPGRRRTGEQERLVFFFLYYEHMRTVISLSGGILCK
jgi:hypothetical protein